MRTTKKILCMILVIVMVLGLLPAATLATGENKVYITVSDEGQFIDNTNGDPLAYYAVDLDALKPIDLNDFGLSSYIYDSDNDGKQDITVMHLFIYVHEEILGLDWNDVTVTGGAGSAYMQDGLFGFEDENLRYNFNGAYPANESGWGLTCDQIVLSAGDFLDVAHYSDFSFYMDSAYGFHHFTDADRNISYDYTAEAGEDFTAKLLLVGGGMGMGDAERFEADYTVYYGKRIGQKEGNVRTDDDGVVTIKFPSAGTWYIWCDGGLGEDMAFGAVVSSPACATVTVSGSGQPEDTEPAPDEPEVTEPEEADTDTVLNVTADKGIQLTATATFCDDCYTQVYNGTKASSIATTINWVCEEHGTTPDTYFYSIGVNAFYDTDYVVTGFTVNGTKYDVNMYDEEYSTVYIDDYSYIAENTNCVSLAIMSAETTAPADQVIHVHAEKVQTAPEQPSGAQDVSAVLNATLAQLAATVTEPAFGTNAGEWTVLCLARGGYYAKDNAYFAGYYNRIVETVNETAASVNMNGALHKNKSTDNSRLIVALSSIGKDATSVGDWDLVEAYSANGMDWIKKQGLNGPIWALIALDSHDYATTDTTLRQQCVDYILSMELDDGGWALNAAATALDVDITGMTLQALYPYRSQPEVAAAAERAFTRLSNEQLETGGFMYGTAETSESAVQVIVACATWGINPDTDSRFIKNGKSVVDNLLSYYIEDEAMFAHQGTASNNMATDQACYALIAYDRLVKGKNALYDMSDVTFDTVVPSDDEMAATLGLPAEVNPGAAFNGVVSINKWDNEAGHKLIDLIVNVPEGVSVTDVTASNRLEGGEISWNMEEKTGKLRIVYFDANENTDLTITGEEFPAELFVISFKADSAVGGSKLSIALTGMSVKLTSDSSDDNAMEIVNIDTAKGTVDVVVGVSFSAVCLYIGDDVDLIPSTKKAIAVAITGIAKGSAVTFNNGETEIVFQYSSEVSEKTGVSTYIALVNAETEMEAFIDEKNYTIGAVSEDAFVFGDINGDGLINAQDALAVVDAWLRKGDEPTDAQILTMNVNGDSRINTFDALGIVEAFVNGTEYGVVTKAATITTKE